MPAKPVLRRWRKSIAGLMTIVAITAIVLGCLRERYRIARAQAYYLKEAAKYARFEKFENAQRSRYLQHALLDKRLIERLADLDSADGFYDHFVQPRVLIRRDIEIYKRSLERGRKALASAIEARMNAKRYSDLRLQYEHAGSCLWLPFFPNPLKLGDEKPLNAAQ